MPGPFRLADPERSLSQGRKIQAGDQNKEK